MRHRVRFNLPTLGLGIIPSGMNTNEALARAVRSHAWDYDDAEEFAVLWAIYNDQDLTDELIETAKRAWNEVRHASTWR